MPYLQHEPRIGESCWVVRQTSRLSPRETSPCSTAWCVPDLSSPRCGRCDQGLERMVVPLVLLVVVAVAAKVPLAAVVLVELAEVLEEVLGVPEVLAQVQLEVALGFALDWDRSCGRVFELWSQ